MGPVQGTLSYLKDIRSNPKTVNFTIKTGKEVIGLCNKAGRASEPVLKLGKDLGFVSDIIGSTLFIQRVGEWLCGTNTASSLSKWKFSSNVCLFAAHATQFFNTLHTLKVIDLGANAAIPGNVRNAFYIPAGICGIYDTALELMKGCDSYHNKFAKKLEKWSKIHNYEEYKTNNLGDDSEKTKRRLDKWNKRSDQERQQVIDGKRNRYEELHNTDEGVARCDRFIQRKHLLAIANSALKVAMGVIGFAALYAGWMAIPAFTVGFSLGWIAVHLSGLAKELYASRNDPWNHRPRTRDLIAAAG